MKGPSNSSHTSGLSSTISFSTVQGMELVNPLLAQDKAKEANDKYFSGLQSWVRSVMPPF